AAPTKRGLAEPGTTGLIVQGLRKPRRPARLGSGRRSGRLSDLGLDLLDDGVEGRLVVDRQFRKDLAIKLDLRLHQPVHENAVGQAVFTRGGVDAGDPEGAEYSLAIAAIAVGILPRLHHRLLGDPEYGTAAAAVSLGLVEDFLVAGAGGYASLDS